MLCWGTPGGHPLRDQLRQAVQPGLAREDRAPTSHIHSAATASWLGPLAAPRAGHTPGASTCLSPRVPACSRLIPPSASSSWTCVLTRK